MNSTLGLVIAAGALAVLYGILQTNVLMRAPTGNDRMREIAAAIQEGAQAYLRRQYMTIAMVGVVVLIILGVLIGWRAGLGFLIGAVLSGAAGFVGMLVSVRANVRTAQAASESLDKGLSIAFRSGAITGMLVAGFALLGVSVYFWILTGPMGLDPTSREVIDSLVALGFGALGEDAAAETGEDGDQGGAEAQGHQRIDHVAADRVQAHDLGQDVVVAGDADEGEARHQHAGHRAGAERHAEALGQALGGRLGGADVGPHRHQHAHIAGGARQDRPDGEAECGAPADQHPHGRENHDADHGDGGVLAAQIGLGAFLDGRGDLAHLVRAGRRAHQRRGLEDPVDHRQHSGGDDQQQ